MHLTMIGHSTVLIEAAGVRLLTDPYLSRFGHIAYGRLAPPALSREDLREVDGVLVSHSHWDHTDRKYFRSLDPSVPVVIPSGISLVMRLKGARTLVPLERWESYSIGDARVTAVPASHIARTAGYVIEVEGRTLYFAGDTYHRRFMEEIGRRFSIDVALMPVTTFRIPPTMGERGGLAAARDLQPKVIIPIHLGIQPRSFLLRSSESVPGFERRLRASGLEMPVVHLEAGQQWESSATSH